MSRQDFEKHRQRIIQCSFTVHEDTVNIRYIRDLEYVHVDLLNNTTEIGLNDGSSYSVNNESLDTKVVKIR